MNVSDGPIGVMRERVHALDREQGTLERGHAVEGDAHDEELEHWVFRHAVPSSAQGHQAIDHAAPRRHPQHHAEQHAECGGPLWQRRVVQVMRAGPDVDEHQRPEVENRQTI